MIHSLFDDVPGPPLTLSRNSDPGTSHLAAVEVAPAIGDLQEWAARCVRERPGLTQRELGAAYCPTDPRKIGRRLAETERLGLTRRGEPRACTVSGRMAETWWPVEHNGGIA